mgnify:CR=1 FL=1
MRQAARAGRDPWRVLLPRGEVDVQHRVAGELALQFHDHEVVRVLVVRQRGGLQRAEDGLRLAVDGVEVHVHQVEADEVALAEIGIEVLGELAVEQVG